PDPRKGERLILVTNHKDPKRGDLAQFARSRGASEMMVPAEVLIVEKLPLLGSGKIDYPALQKFVAERVKPEGAVVAAQGRWPRRRTQEAGLTAGLPRERERAGGVQFTFDFAFGAGVAPFWPVVDLLTASRIGLAALLPRTAWALLTCLTCFTCAACLCFT